MKPTLRLPAASDTGGSSTDKVTRDNTPDLVGRADPFSIIRGVYAVRGTDIAGNSATSGATAVTIDTLIAPSSTGTRPRPIEFEQKVGTGSAACPRATGSSPVVRRVHEGRTALVEPSVP